MKNELILRNKMVSAADRKCTCCHVEHDNLRKRIKVRDDLSYERCTNCGHLDQSCRSTDDSFQVAQQRYYFNSIEGAFKEQMSFDDERLQVRKRTISQLVKGGHAIEVGPGRGTFLQWVRERGFTVSAVEHSPVVAQELRARLNLPVIEGAFEIAVIADESFDAVFTFHVIEHVPDAEAHLKTAFRILKPGGFLFVATPNGSSWQHRLPAMLAPNFSSAHLRLFSKQSLETLCHRAGFSTVKISTPEYTSAWLRVCSKLLRRLRNEDAEQTAGKYASGSSFRSQLLIRLFKLLSWPMRLIQEVSRGGNELFFVFQKNGDSNIGLQCSDSDVETIPCAEQKQVKSVVA